MENNEPVWKEYDGKEVVLKYSDGTILGKMAIDLERNCIDFLPYMAYEPNGKNVRLETETPRRISLNIFGLNSFYDIQSIRNGNLEKKVEVINREVGGSNGVWGFNQK